ncbi:MAG: RHS repeat-associated core domain-containing protein [Thermodesulfobacteriota bacterium]
MSTVISKSTESVPMLVYTRIKREWNREAGLYYYRASYYDPETGGFASKDPIAFEKGINLGGYVGAERIIEAEAAAAAAGDDDGVFEVDAEWHDVCITICAANHGFCVSMSDCPYKVD